jgi:hypothetical protein
MVTDRTAMVADEAGKAKSRSAPVYRLEVLVFTDACLA